MFNVGAPELLVILLVALIVLGPDKLPEAARKVGRFAGEVRRMSSGFQDELRDALQEPVDQGEPTRRSDPVPKAPPPVKPWSQALPDEAVAADPSTASPGVPPADDPGDDSADQGAVATPAADAGEPPRAEPPAPGAEPAGTADGERSEADAR